MCDEPSFLGLGLDKCGLGGLDRPPLPSHDVTPIPASQIQLDPHPYRSLSPRLPSILSSSLRLRYTVRSERQARAVIFSPPTYRCCFPPHSQWCSMMQRMGTSAAPAKLIHQTLRLTNYIIGAPPFFNSRIMEEVAEQPLLPTKATFPDRTMTWLL